MDMSIGGTGAGKVVTLVVGPERRMFEVHSSRLIPMSVSIDLQSGREVDLPDEDPEVFNLLVNWVYHEPLPLVADLPPKINLPYPLYAKLPPTRRPPVQQEDPENPNQLESSDNICLLSIWRRWSQEEFRLSSPAYSKTLNIERTPEAEAKATDLQRNLLKLMLLAEKHKWEELHNDAMDAFRCGEKRLKVQSIDPEYVKLAYKSTIRRTQRSLIKTFIIEHAFSLAFHNQEMSRYVDLFTEIPLFLVDIMKKLDGHSTIRKNITLHDSTTHHNDGALDSKLSFHVHGGNCKLDCSCYADFEHRLSSAIRWTGTVRGFGLKLLMASDSN